MPVSRRCLLGAGPAVALAGSVGMLLRAGSPNGAHGITLNKSPALRLRDFATAGSDRDQAAGIQRAVNEAVARGSVLMADRNAEYRIGQTINLPPGCVIAGEGCTFRAIRDIVMFQQMGRACLYHATFIGPANGFGEGVGILCRADNDSRGDGVAPQYVEDCEYEALGFAGLGRSALELRFVRGIRARQISVQSIGYAGILGYSVEDFDGVGFTGDTFHGERWSDELNAYAISFTSRQDSNDTERDPPSRRCSYRSGSVANLPTWHALDTHGGHNISFSDFEMRNVRRAVAITHRGTASAEDCEVRNIRTINDLPFSPSDFLARRRSSPTFNSNGVLKRDSALWCIGASRDQGAKRIAITNVTSRGHGRPAARNAAFVLENSDAVVTGCTDEDSWQSGILVNGGYTGQIIGHRCVNPTSFTGSPEKVVRVLESRGGNFSADFDYVRTRPLPPGITDRSVVVVGAGPDNRVILSGKAAGTTEAEIFVEGDRRFISRR
jgi:hypothetical protein